MAKVPDEAIESNESDDIAFVIQVRHLVQAVVDQRMPDKLFLVRIDNWFGESWLGFGGKIEGAVGVHPAELTIPPFKPTRVVRERVFERAEHGAYSEVDSAEKLHLDIHSEANLRRRIQGISTSGVFVWYSGNSKPNGRGSVLVYESNQEGAAGWYAGFEKADAWRVATQNGISRDAVDSLVAH